MAVYTPNPPVLVIENGTWTQSPSINVGNIYSSGEYMSSYTPSSKPLTYNDLVGLQLNQYVEWIKLSTGGSVVIRHYQDSWGTNLYELKIKLPDGTYAQGSFSNGLGSGQYVDFLFFEDINVFGIVQYNGSSAISYSRQNFGFNVTDWINGAIPIVYHFVSATHLTGADGQFTMNLSIIDQTLLGDGTPYTETFDGSKFNLKESSNIRNIISNLGDGESTIAYCGDNYITATIRTTNVDDVITKYCTLKFYFWNGVHAYTEPEFVAWGNYSGIADKYLCIMYDSVNEGASPNIISFFGNSGKYGYNRNDLPSEISLGDMYTWLQANGAGGSSPYDTGSTDDGGTAGPIRTQDHIGAGSTPTMGGLDLGIITLYRPTPAQLQSISAFLWSDNVLDNFKKYFNNFADNLISLMSLPFKPGNLSAKTFKVGNMTSEITNVDYVTQRYYDIDMGEVTIDSKWGSYLDYSPYTKIEVFLPALGTHSLDADELLSPTTMDGYVPVKQGTVLKLMYRLDILTGLCVAFIYERVQTQKNSDTYVYELRYQFTGKMGKTMPLTGQIYDNLVNSLITAGAGLATTIATGGLTAPMSAAAAVTATVQAQKPSVERVGQLSGDVSMLACQVPYITISVPNKPYMESQEKFTGFPSYKTGTIGSFSGYTEVIDAHVEGVSCTDEERTKILDWLKGGVIL